MKSFVGLESGRATRNRATFQSRGVRTTVTLATTQSQPGRASLIRSSVSGLRKNETRLYSVICITRCIIRPKNGRHSEWKSGNGGKEGNAPVVKKSVSTNSLTPCYYFIFEGLVVHTTHGGVECIIRQPINRLPNDSIQSWLVSPADHDPGGRWWQPIIKRTSNDYEQ